MKGIGIGLLLIFYCCTLQSMHLGEHHFTDLDESEGKEEAPKLFKRQRTRLNYIFSESALKAMRSGNESDQLLAYPVLTTDMLGVLVSKYVLARLRPDTSSFLRNLVLIRLPYMRAARELFSLIFSKEADNPVLDALLYALDPTKCHDPERCCDKAIKFYFYYHHRILISHDDPAVVAKSIADFIRSTHYKLAMITFHYLEDYGEDGIMVGRIPMMMLQVTSKADIYDNPETLKKYLKNKGVRPGDCPVTGSTLQAHASSTSLKVEVEQAVAGVDKKKPEKKDSGFVAAQATGAPKAPSNQSSVCSVM